MRCTGPSDFAPDRRNVNATTTSNSEKATTTKTKATVRFHQEDAAAVLVDTVRRGA